MATLYNFTPYAAEFNSASFPQPLTVNSTTRVPVLAFDAASPQYAMWSFIAPSGITAPYKVFAQGAMNAATSGSLMFQVFVESVAMGGTCNIGNASYFDTANSSCAIGVPTTACLPFTASLQLTNTASLGQGQKVRLMIGRNATSGSDDATGAWCLTGVEFRDSQ